MSRDDVAVFGALALFLSNTPLAVVTPGSAVLLTKLVVPVRALEWDDELDDCT